MARPRKFDDDVVKECVLDLFWLKGYDYTAVEDLERATGVDRRGLYNAFGSKLELFRESLETFIANGERQVLAALNSEYAGRADIERVLRLLASPEGYLKENRGCLVCLTAGSEVMHSEEVGRCVRGYFRRLRNAFANALRGAFAAGDLGMHRDPEVLCDFLVGTVMGLAAMARAGRPRAQVRRFVETALESLD
jgi:TetR/AcrR family transcriptional repressor of nem operon